MINGNKIKMNNQSLIIYLTAAIIVVLDQTSKYIIKSTMQLYDSFDVIGSFFKITYIENAGMAFGIQMGSRTVFVALSILAAIIVFIYLLRMPNEQFLFRFSLALIMGGAIGNLIDRIAVGRVVDFLDVEFFDISLPAFNFLFIDFPGYSLTRWPVFNVADSAVTCGMILIFWHILFQKAPHQQESSA
jgi:signal peptidase II